MRLLLSAVTLLAVINVAQFLPLQQQQQQGGLPTISLAPGPVTRGLGGPGFGYGFAPGLGVNGMGALGGVGGFDIFSAMGIGNGPYGTIFDGPFAAPWGPPLFGPIRDPFLFPIAPPVFPFPFPTLG